MGLVTRSIYAIQQLRQWIAAFRDHFGPENFLDHLLILESEAMHVESKRTTTRFQRSKTSMLGTTTPWPTKLKNTYKTCIGRTVGGCTNCWLHMVKKSVGSRKHNTLVKIQIQLDILTISCSRIRIGIHDGSPNIFGQIHWNGISNLIAKLLVVTRK
jgi:hypothetical protein